ncbi:DUF302 domain-containing protein [Paraburkholderia sp. RL18-085-BIA-A]|uniref:DUF302 domain-containing protein n=1 Tax=Paraburkholderia sp. RL18-085-BIA-A TaxID=3031633 RepID=UPI0038BB09D2
MAAFWTLQNMTAQAQETPYPARTQTLTSQHDFPTTVSRLNEALASHGVTLFADIDQSAAAAHAGTTLRSTRLFLFGNPKGGTPLMQANPHAAVELPLRAVVWEDDHGTTRIDYQDVSGVLSSDYGLPQKMVAPLAAVRVLLEGVAGGK